MAGHDQHFSKLKVLIVNFTAVLALNYHCAVVTRVSVTRPWKLLPLYRSVMKEDPLAVHLTDKGRGTLLSVSVFICERAHICSLHLCIVISVATLCPTAVVVVPDVQYSFPGRRKNSLATSASSNCYFRCLIVGSTNQISECCHMTTVNCIMHWTVTVTPIPFQ